MAEELKPKVVDAELVPPVRLTKQGKPYRKQVRDKIKHLPEDVHQELDRRLEARTYSYESLSEWLEEEHGVQIGKTSIHAYNRQRELNLLAVKRATEEARQIVALTGGDNQEINRLLTMLAQTKIYDMLVQMNIVVEAFDRVEKANQESVKRLRTRNKKKHKDGTSPSESDDDFATERPNKAALAAVSALVKNTTVIGHHVIETDKWDLDREIKLAQLVKTAEEKVSRIASEAGLSPEVEKTIRAALMEIKA
jgi:hypothetical protein